MFNNDNKTDNYITNRDGWESIKKFIPKNKIIYSPFYCDGSMKKYFKELGYDIIHNNEDFFKNYNKYKYDIIIDNPPFSKRHDIFKKLKEIDKPFIIICLSNLIACKYFTNLFNDNLQIIIPRSRTKFTKYQTTNNNYTPPMGTFFYCYKMNFDKDLIFI